MARHHAAQSLKRDENQYASMHRKVTLTGTDRMSKIFIALVEPTRIAFTVYSDQADMPTGSKI
jgi:hypothetical protein